ncbi:MAG: amidohydrolase family protein [Candidatus Acidiferrales bacterium]
MRGAAGNPRISRKKFLTAIACILAVFAAISLTSLRSLAAATDKPKPLVLDHVTVIDVTGGPALADRTVIVSGDTIATIAKSGSVQIPKGAQLINGHGKFLIPGLWDMHTHIAGVSANPSWARNVLIPLLVANGITGIRDMGGDLDALEEWRREIESGTLIGPRIVAAGPMLLPARRAGAPTAPADPAVLRVGTPGEARAAVDSLQKRGANFIKIIELSRENYFAVAEQSKKDGISFAGHIPSEVNATEASNAGQKSIEHIVYSSLAFDCSSEGSELRQKYLEAAKKHDDKTADALTEEARRTFSPERAAALWQTFKSNGTWVTPTLFSIWENAHHPEDSPDDPALAYLPQSLRKEWAPKPPTQQDKDAEAWWRPQFENDSKLTGEMNRGGVHLLAGSDSLDRYVFVGTSLHRELQMLVGAGLTPLEALRTATSNPTEFLAQKNAGAISQGGRADMVLLDRDPTKDISNTQKIAGVVLRGNLLTRSNLDTMLAEARAAAAAIPAVKSDAK